MNVLEYNANLKAKKGYFCLIYSKSTCLSLPEKHFSYVELLKESFIIYALKGRLIATSAQNIK